MVVKIFTNYDINIGEHGLTSTVRSSYDNDRAVFG